MAADKLPEFDSIVVGAGFAGLYMLYRLREMGHRTLALEKGSGVGGTWYWNRYPGARCDVASMEYSYQFDEALQQEWNWSERYAPQTEILEYANHVADRFALRRHIRFGSTVVAASYDEVSNVWSLRYRDATGQTGESSATFLVAATGCLSSPNQPGITGLDQFNGSIYHTGNWPKQPLNFSGQRVAVIGTGSSGIQAIPMIAEQASQLTVFQRTANYTVPAHNAPMDPESRDHYKANYSEFRKQAAATRNGQLKPPNQVSALAVSAEQRHQEFESRWRHGGLAFLGAFNDLIVNDEANQFAADFVRDKIMQQVADPAVARRLCPTTKIGCKRLCVDTNYYATYNRANVRLVDINETPIERVTPNAMVVDGQLIPLDAIVLATGYDAMTGALLKMNISGRGDLPLTSSWREGAKTYLGISTHHFPNLFLITGPGSPSVLTNMLPSIEQHVNLISALMEYASSRGATRIEAEADAQAAWVEHVNNLAAKTIYPTCNSWYLGANIPGKPRVFMPYVGFADYLRECKAIVDAGYRGFKLST